MRRRIAWVVSVVVALLASPGTAQIPEAPGSGVSGPRDENPGHSSGGLDPVIVPTEREASPPEIVELMNRSRANAEATKASGKAKNASQPLQKPTPPR
jgi:hypothetical protein